MRKYRENYFITISNRYNAPSELSVQDMLKPFQTSRENNKQLGLGLTVAWAIVERFGGTLEISEAVSDTDVEFKAVVSFKTLETSAEAVDPIEEEGIPGLVKKITEYSTSPFRLLLVEDEEVVSSALEKILQITLGQAIELEIHTSKGNDALEIIEANDNFQAILCDLNLSGSSGRFIFDWVMKNKPQLENRFAFLTGDKGQKAAQMYLATTRRPYLLKPFEAENLLRLLLNLVSKAKSD